eukprot:Tamp_05219.p1 GENE.Tamp_05219~~Tamp_05219.p1  ORF type:complete len:712 (-),score=132.47 Tamp_05219:106-2241(-)
MSCECTRKPVPTCCSLIADPHVTAANSAPWSSSCCALATAAHASTATSTPGILHPAVAHELAMAGGGLGLARRAAAGVGAWRRPAWKGRLLSTGAGPLEEVRVRYAPSPTGAMHLGGLRTALYNYLFARRHGGTLVLRIEDTDKTREVAGSADDIVQVLRWSNITPDEGYGVAPPGAETQGRYGPYVQSQRLSKYRKAAEMLVAHGFAYKCFYTDEQVQHYRQVAEAKDKRGFVFKLGPASEVLGVDFRRFQMGKKPEEEEAHTIRLHSDALVSSLTGGTVGAGGAGAGPAVVEVEDMIRGVVRFPADKIDDVVLLKSDGFPSYHLANVVDDAAMRISHVIRGEEWLPSACKHVLLYHAFNTIAAIREEPPVKMPMWAHLPLLLNPTGGKLSKRHSHGSVTALLDAGYEPEAVVNYIAALGFTFESDTIIQPLSALAAQFDLSRVHAGGAQINTEKLDSLQATAIRSKLTQEPPSPELLHSLAQSVLAALRHDAKVAGTHDWEKHLGKGTPVRWDLASDPKYLSLVMKITHQRITKRGDLARNHLYFWRDPPAEGLAKDPKLGKDTEVLEALARLCSQVSDLRPSCGNAVSSLLDLSRQFPVHSGDAQQIASVKKGPFLKAVRLSVTGESGGPDLAEILAALGPDVIVRRLGRALAAASSSFASSSAASPSSSSVSSTPSPLSTSGASRRPDDWPFLKSAGAKESKSRRKS